MKKYEGIDLLGVEGCDIVYGEDGVVLENVKRCEISYPLSAVARLREGKDATE